MVLLNSIGKRRRFCEVEATCPCQAFHWSIYAKKAGSPRLCQFVLPQVNSGQTLVHMGVCVSAYFLGLAVRMNVVERTCPKTTRIQYTGGGIDSIDPETWNDMKPGKA